MKENKTRISRFPVFHVPHDGWKFPEELMNSVCVPDAVFRAYHEQMRDKYVTRLIPSAYCRGNMLCSFDVSRLLCDVERFIGSEEVMERYGMGYCYEKAYDGTVIKQVTDEIRQRTLRYYRDHHCRMDGLCERHPRMLLFDLHSFHDEIVPKEFLRAGVQTPDLCIGTDARYTPRELKETVIQRFEEAGLSVAVDYPYSGVFIPDCVMDGSSDCDLAGIMLEFHRRAYLDEQGKIDLDKAERIRNVIRQIVEDCEGLD